MVALTPVLLAAAGPVQRFGALTVCCIPVGIILFSLAALAFWVYCIIEVVTKEPPAEPNKIMWLLIVLLLNVLGGVIYIVARRPERVRKYGR